MSVNVRIRYVKVLVNIENECKPCGSEAEPIKGTWVTALADRWYNEEYILIDKHQKEIDRIRRDDFDW